MKLLLLLSLAASAAPPPPTVDLGQPALAFTLPAVNESTARELVRNNRVSLSDFTGVLAGYPADWVVLYFFSRERGGQNLVELDRLARKYDRRGVRVLAISTDSGDIGALSDWVEGLNPEVPVLRDNHGIVSSRYGITALPTVFIVDSDGVVVSRGVPAASTFAEHTEQAITSVLER